MYESITLLCDVAQKPKIKSEDKNKDGECIHIKHVQCILLIGILNKVRVDHSHKKEDTDTYTHCFTFFCYLVPMLQW